MDDLAKYCGAVRKYSMNIITASHFMEVKGLTRSDPRMPVSRLRRYLSQYGLRGEALGREVRRIVAGPDRLDNTVKAGIYYTWPYGWEPADFTPMMRRILSGKCTRHVMMFDEFRQVLRK